MAFRTMTNVIGKRLALLLPLLCGGVGLCADEPAAVTVPAAGRPAPSAAVADQVQLLLDEGFVAGPKALAAARKRYESVQRLAGDDPRIDYAFGLVLLRQTQHKQALTQFENGTKRPGAPYWPAWQALIWGQLVDKQYDKGLASLVQYATLVRQASPGDELTEAQRAAARWMGEVLEAANRVVAGRKAQQELIARHLSDLATLLGDDLYDELELGRDVVEERAFAVAQEAGFAEADAEKKLARRRQSQADKLDSDLKDLGKEKENAARSAEETKKRMEETLAKLDKQLGQMERDYQQLTDRAQSLDQSIALVGRELTALDLQLNTTNPRQSNSVGLQQRQYAGQTRMIELQNQMFNYQLEYNATVGRMAQTAQQGQAAMQQRALLVQKFEKATGEISRKNEELDKWSARVADKKKKLTLQQTAKAKGAKAPADRNTNKVVSFKSYAPLALEVEKGRLLEEIGIVSPDQPKAADR